MATIDSLFSKYLKNSERNPLPQSALSLVELEVKARGQLLFAVFTSRSSTA